MASVYLTPPIPGFVAIYTLSDPRTGEVRYVGKSVNPDRRYQKHLLSPKTRPHFYTSRWIARLQAIGANPIINIIEWVAPAVWEEAERRHIAAHKVAGFRLTNATDGGEGHAGLRPTPEVRARMAEGQRRRWAALTDEERARAKSGLCPRKRSGKPPKKSKTLREHDPVEWQRRRDEKTARLIERNKARKSTRNKPIALRHADPEAFAAMRSRASLKAAQTRRDQGTSGISESHRAALSVFNKGRPQTDEARAKRSATLKGRQFSEETRAKMSESAKKRSDSAWVDRILASRGQSRKATRQQPSVELMQQLALPLGDTDV